MIVSLGTGCFFEEKKEFAEPTLGWDGIINQVSGRSRQRHLDVCVALRGRGLGVFARPKPSLSIRRVLR